MNARKDRQKPLKVTIYLAGIFIVVLTLWTGLLLTNKYEKE